jgi:hypothetical protein
MTTHRPLTTRSSAGRYGTTVHLDVSGAMFDDAAAEDLQFDGERLGGARFARCDLRGVEIVSSDVRGMRIDGVLVTDLLAAFFRSDR